MMLHELFVAHGSYSRMQAEESEKKILQGFILS